MTLATPCPPAPAAYVTQPTTDHLLDTPLPQLLAEFRVDVSELPIEDPGFTGGTYVRDDGSLFFAMREGQPAAEREMIARAMLGEALRVPMPELPAPYQLTVLAR
ncbi:hypothetical protein OOK29_09625 [Streptomyces phaeochromogenes]|uniref:hypothetical protein n=1 Tax=Streptomyces phaeochromogenes TaxID=1923 RepID=UPI002254DA35|nr:hypothetical protein [Streptomyces phaeochromogenes]MCX5598396.1 hypothetical protein [Streptomyces phaeochromogenes]